MFGMKKKKLVKGQLSEINVDLISLLFDDYTPANQKDAVWKCGSKSYNFIGMVSKHSTDDQGRIYVTVIEPDTVDSQGDVTTAAEIQKAKDRFAQGGMLKKNDVNHDMKPIDDCFISESYILKTADKEHFPNTKIGSWVLEIKVKDTNSELWKKIKSGKFNGVSLYGTAYASEIAEVKAGMDTIIKAIESLKDLNDPAVKPAIDELEKELEWLKSQSQTAETEAQIKELQKTISTVVSTITKAINTQIKGEPCMTEVDREVRIGDEKIVMKGEKIELYKAFGDIDSGSKINLLTDNLGGQFIDTVFDFSPADTFSDISVVELDKDEKVDKGFISDLILKNSADTGDLDAVVGEFDLSVPTEILKGRLTLSQDTVEFYRDKKGEDEFGAYVEQKLAQKIAKAVRKLFFRGDRTSTDPALKSIKGIIAHMTGTTDAHAKTKTSTQTYASILSACLKDFSNDALSELDGFKIYCSPKTLLDIQDEYAKRQTATGDKFLLHNDKITFKGMEVKPRHLPDDVFIIGLSKFLILGYRTDATLKVEHVGDDWVWKWNVRVRFGTKYIPGGMVKMFTITSA